ncbi:hypothetical protein QAD02_005932 [Eretmocerus hayati]|uniref:Uncharacterized protein n=1 Tax=Eretmocerus hayati TaxID=131215 RepID=A0ACC2MZP4_9HYME|nr:hypothetical protein QAD02_005932 [Eretmocerus hayati]
MESVDNFMTLFSKSWQTKNYESISNVLKGTKDYLRNVPKTEIGRALEIIFDEHGGLFKFLNTVLNLSKAQITIYNSPLREAFLALEIIMEIFKEEYEPYISETRAVCFLCIQTFCWHYARRAAAITFSKSIELFPENEVSLDELVQHYNLEYSRKYQSREGSIFYIILGAIAKYCPKTPNMVKYIDPIFIQLLQDLKMKCETAIQAEEIKIYVECMSDLLIHYVPFEGEAKRHEFFEKCYHLLIKLMDSNKTKKNVKSKIVYILRTQMKHFSSCVSKDWMKWHTLLWNALEESDDFSVRGAVRSFFNTISYHVSCNDAEDTFLFFKNFLAQNLCDQSLTPSKLELTIYGLGEFSIAYKKYSPLEISGLFQMIALRACSNYLRENGVVQNFVEVADFLQALSKLILHIPNVSQYHVNSITELSIYFIKRFPDLRGSFMNHVISALKMTFSKMILLGKNLYHEYFSSLFQEGIMWSCSHTLLVDVELQQEIQNLSKPPVCYKDYVPLWFSLFNADKNEKHSRFLIPRIFSEFISVFKHFLSKLDLSVNITDDSSDNDLIQLTAHNQSDFRFFVNLVDLYVEIFEATDSVRFENHVDDLLRFLIRYSYQHPMVSGFYKVIEVILKKTDLFADHQHFLSESTANLIIQYITHVLEYVREVSGELQLSCVTLILNSPSKFIKNLVDRMLPVFKIAFHIGLTDISSAFYALRTLENWIKLNVQCTCEFLKQIIYYLEPYLSSEESSIDIVQNIKKTGRQARKNTVIVDDAETLENFQRNILLFFGSLEPHIMNTYIHESNITNASWDKKNLLQCELLFPDIRLELHFDKFVPRLIELSGSGDRKTKVAACELLHAFIAIILGKKLIDQCFNKILCSTILNLGCDPDDGVKNLFHPLIIQLTHYLSSKLMKDSRVPQDFINCLFEGLADEMHPSLRDHCGLYLKEFAQWSIKQSTERDLTNQPNLRSIIRRITTNAVYPSNSKRLAAAIAFNNLYAVLREDTSVVNIYWLEFLYAFVKSLEDCKDVQITNALGHIEKVIRVKVELFNAKSNNRRKPPDFVGVTLESAVTWLFEYCGTANTKCEWKCHEIFENLLPLVSNIESTKNQLEKIVVEIVERCPKDDLDFITKINAQRFLRILGFYTWILQKKFLAPESLGILKIDCTDGQTFSSYFKKFVSLITNRPEQMVTNLNSEEVEELSSFGTEIILRILDFISTLYVIKSDAVDNGLWNDDLSLLIVRCALCPSKIEFSDKSLQSIEKLYQHLEKLLDAMNEYGNQARFNQLRNHVIQEAMELQIFANIQNIVNRTTNLPSKRSLQGLTLMKKYRIIDLEGEKLDEDVKIYLQDLMQFLLNIHQEQGVRVSINLIMQDNPLKTAYSTTISHGEYFLENFKNPLLCCMLRSPSETMKIIEQTLMEIPDKLFFFLEELLLFAQSNKIQESEVLANEILNKCETYRRLISDLERRKLKFFNINRLAITLKKKPIEAAKKDGVATSLHWWIVEELLKAKDLETKTTVLRNFFMCLADEDESQDDRQLLLVFKDLREENSTSYAEKLRSDAVLKFQATSCYQVLLKMLVATKSPLVYQLVMRYVAGVVECMVRSDVKEHLKSYFACVRDSTALRSLQASYDIFMELNSTQDRFDVLHEFLLPSIELTKSSVVKQFYEKNCQDMVAHVTKKIPDMATVTDRSKLYISKTGCYSMFALMFAKYELEFLNVTDPTSATEKPLNRVLSMLCLEVRCLNAKGDDDPELLRQLHCAALNCCISMVSLKREERFYKFIFLEDRAKGQLIWEKIVDCERVYQVQQPPSSIRQNRRKLLNIRKADELNANDPLAASFAYFHHYDLSCLSLLEDVHAYDLNDTRVLSSAIPQPEHERRLGLSFEIDELNEHECMPTVAGLLVHMFNSGVAQLADPNSKKKPTAAEMPDCLRLLRNGFCTRHDNVRLFLLRLVGNTKHAFLPHAKLFLVAIADALCGYLSTKQLNYVIRDVIVVLIEAKIELKLEDRAECNAACKLIQALVLRTPDEHSNIYKYNLELLESLCRQWSSVLECPANLRGLAVSNPDLVLNVVLILLRSGEKHATLMSESWVRELTITQCQQYKGAEQNVLMRFEALGWMLKLSDEPTRQEQIQKLGEIFTEMDKMSRERCARCVCAVFKGCRSEDICKPIFKFARPDRVADSQKPECLELFLQRLPSLTTLDIETELLWLNLSELLRQHRPGCELSALRILEKVIDILSDSQLRDYCQLARGFVSSASNVLEIRKQALAFLTAAYPRCPEQALPGLLAALDDPADEIRCAAPWASRELLAYATAPERLSRILKLPEQGPGLEGFARLLCLEMLELTGSSIDAQRPMFPPLIDDCRFTEREVLVPKRRFNFGSMAPMFAPSLSSQLAKYSRMSPTQQSSYTGTLRLLATARPEFEPTQAGSVLSSTAAGSDWTRKLPDPSQNRLSARLYVNKTGENSWQNLRQSSADQQRRLKREMELRRDGVKLYRKYRSGDFPDVELTHASFVESLKQLALRDWLICKELSVALMRAMLERLRGTDRYTPYLNQLSSTARLVLGEISRSHGSDALAADFAPALLELALHTNEIELNVASIGSVCRKLRLDAVGILLLERDCSNGSCTGNGRDESEEDMMGESAPPAKRMRRDESKLAWVELASLYKSVGEIDAVTSIFKRSDLFSEDLREATLAHALGQWSSARDAYDRAYEPAFGVEQEHCLQSHLECLRELSSWDRINRRTGLILNGRWETVWESPKREQLLPWIFEAQLHKVIDDFTSNRNVAENSFIENFESWIRGREVELRKLYGEQMAMLYVADMSKEDRAGHCVRCCLDEAKKRWIRSTSLAENQRKEIAERLRGMRNIDAYANTIKSSNEEGAVLDLLNYWKNSLPEEVAGLSAWVKHVNYRLAFAHLLHDKIRHHEDEFSNLKLNDLVEASVQQRIGLSVLALKIGNGVVAKKHMQQIEHAISNQLEEAEYPGLSSEFTLLASKYKFVCGEAETNLQKKSAYYIHSWQVANRVLDDETALLRTKTEAQHHLFDLAASLQRQAFSNPTLVDRVLSDVSIRSSMGMNGLQDTTEALKSFSLNILRSACGSDSSGPSQAESWCKMGKYCHNLLESLGYKASLASNAFLHTDFISSILKAMALGSLEAARYFPCLLKPNVYRDSNSSDINSASNLFKTLSAKVPSWLFLPWQAQILSHLPRPTLKPLLKPLLERLAEDYPGALMYSLRVSRQAMPELRDDSELTRVYKKLFKNERLERLFDAMHRVCQPELYLAHHLDRIGNLEERIDWREVVQDIAEKLFGERVTEHGLQGVLYKDLDRYRAELQKVQEMDTQAAQGHLDRLSHELLGAMRSRLENSRRQALNLKDYSPYLSRFSGESLEIEIPGQYVDYQKPLPRYHSKIAKFERFVSVMESKCSPIRIGLIGDDAKTHNFLVKFSEDLRQDQRLQQLFKLTNRILSSDANCRRRNLSITTYNVVPLSTSLGLIQWVNGTKSLSDYIQYSVQDAQLIDNVATEYHTWIQRASGGKRVAQSYREAVVKYTPEQVIEKMHQLEVRIDQGDSLRKTFVMLSPSLETFVAVRRNFVASYATMCIVHWVTGVGDRHPGNLLIDVSSGKCCGIDFGCAFGAGIDQSIPELVPFRLTAQILGLLKPFDAQAVFGATMSHALSALRADKGPVLACLEVFIYEALDWWMSLRQRLEKEDEKLGDKQSWLPKSKFEFVKEKLDGGKPSTVMVKEFMSAHSASDNEDVDKDKHENILKRYQEIIRGSHLQRDKSARLRLKNEHLSSEEQVECLLELATDLNALGRMYAGWRPFL